MKTRCPGCETTFRVTPEQLKARAGKVRCGQCQTVFNALDSLLEEAATAGLAGTPAALQPPRPAPHFDKPTTVEPITTATPPPAPEAEIPPIPEPPNEPLTDAQAQELAIASGLIVPRETTEIPGYSKWAEGVMSSPALPTAGKSSSWPFTLVAFLLLFVLSGQLVFHFRGEIAVAVPSLRPALETLSEVLDADIPLPHHADLVSIETSDLQADPARSNLLVLQATLRNRATYGQAYPLLELTLTDTQDNAIARKVFQPGDYLSPANPPNQTFPASADVAVRLWIEARDLSAAGYRLYVFYP